MPGDIPTAPANQATRPDADWLTIRDVAGRLSVSQWQVRKWVACGQFDEIVVFSRKLTRISLGAYHRFVAKSREKTA